MDEFNSDGGGYGTSIRRILTLCGAVGVIGVATMLHPDFAETGMVKAQWLGGLKDATTSVVRFVSGAVQVHAPQSAQPAKKKHADDKDFDHPLGSWSSDATAEQGGSGGGGAGAGAGSSNVHVTIHESDGDDTYTLRIENGKTTAEINGKAVPEDRIRRRGDKIQILGENGEVLKSFQAGQGQGVRRLQLQGLPGGQGGTFWVAPQGATPGAGFSGTVMDGKPPKVMLGITMSTPDDEARESLSLEDGAGIVVDTVKPGLAADKAGLKAGDVIIAIEGHKGATQEKLREILRSKEPGDTVSLKVHRKDDGEQQLKVKLQAFDAEKLGVAGALSGGGQGGPQVWSFSDSDKTGKDMGEAMKDAMKQAEQAHQRAMEALKRHAEGAARAGGGHGDPEIMLFDKDGQRPAASREMRDQLKQLQERNADLDKRLAELNERLDKLQKMLDRMNDKRGDGR
jgi:hypothetical protein